MRQEGRTGRRNTAGGRTEAWRYERKNACRRCERKNATKKESAPKKVEKEVGAEMIRWQKEIEEELELWLGRRVSKRGRKKEMKGKRRRNTETVWGWGGGVGIGADEAIIIMKHQGPEIHLGEQANDEALGLMKSDDQGRTRGVNSHGLIQGRKFESARHMILIAI
ncbi:uncharacterized protein DS421_5g155290 [Arachis hypogaea]|nr:uncharacterized protein DS421_5g155290 [Arachis hypogaea]